MLRANVRWGLAFMGVFNLGGCGSVINLIDLKDLDKTFTVLFVSHAQLGETKVSLSVRSCKMALARLFLAGSDIKKFTNKKQNNTK